jgi:hypothetical protein
VDANSDSARSTNAVVSIVSRCHGRVSDAPCIKTEGLSHSFTTTSVRAEGVATVETATEKIATRPAYPSDERKHENARRKALWDKRIANGDCAHCGRPRGKEGSTRSCRGCLDKYAIRKRKKLVKTIPVTPQRHREDGVRRVNHVVSLYPEDVELLNQLKRHDGCSRSEIIRRALRLYHEASE